jgi:hypothetical protein
MLAGGGQLIFPEFIIQFITPRIEGKSLYRKVVMIN